MAFAAASVVATGAATTMGLGLGAKDVSQAAELFKLQMRQAKRLWAADWAESSWRHGEELMQSAQQHSESQAIAAATYFQQERVFKQQFRQAHDQDTRAFEMSWRAEAREALRDELANLNNRFNNVMLCDTVCLGCAFGMVVEGEPPHGTQGWLLMCYVSGLGLSICLFTCSLWASIIILRRLNEHTASVLERKLYHKSEDLQRKWEEQLQLGVPTGAGIMQELSKTYEQWVNDNCEPMGNRAIFMLSSGVVALFFSAGMLTHAKYVLEFKATGTVMVFWAFVLITAGSVLLMQWVEDRTEKRKEGAYSADWHDQSNSSAANLYSKVNSAGERLRTHMNEAHSADGEDVARLVLRESEERAQCAATDDLTVRFELLQQQAAERRRIRGEVVKILTSAKEERDALPEELTSVLNKLLYDVDDIDGKTAETVSTHSATMRMDDVAEALGRTSSSRGGQAATSEANDSALDTSLELPRSSLADAAPAAVVCSQPLDSNTNPVNLTTVRRALGDISRTTLIRILNKSDEPLHLLAGRKLESGQYVDACPGPPAGTTEQAKYYDLTPPSAVQPGTEVVVAARSGGASWLATSGIEGEIIYSNRDGSWHFVVSFANLLVKNVRTCHTSAVKQPSADDALRRGSSSLVEWVMTRDELDRKVNAEVHVIIDKHRGQEAAVSRETMRRTQAFAMRGYLFKNAPTGLRLRWQKRFFVLTGSELQYFEAEDAVGRPAGSIALKDIEHVKEGKDAIKDWVFEIHLKESCGREPYRLSAIAPNDRWQWLRAISQALSASPNSNFASGASTAGGTSASTRSTLHSSERDEYAPVPLAEPLLERGSNGEPAPEPQEADAVPTFNPRMGMSHSMGQTDFIVDDEPDANAV